MKKVVALFFGMLVLLSFSSCFVFRKKNRCGDCPHWSRSLDHQHHKPVR